MTFSSVFVHENVTHTSYLRPWNIGRPLPNLLRRGPGRFANDLQVADDPILDELIPLEYVSSP
jgi:hypothetical protein